MDFKNFKAAFEFVNHIPFTNSITCGNTRIMDVDLLYTHNQKMVRAPTRLITIFIADVPFCALRFIDQKFNKKVSSLNHDFFFDGDKGKFVIVEKHSFEPGTVWEIVLIDGGLKIKENGRED